MTDVPEVYALGLVSSGKLKIRATARLAEGTPDSVFDACVLLHEAARVERRVVGALSTCPATTRLAASVEECFCLLEGRDPPGAAGVWGRIVREREDMVEGVATALLARVGPRYAQTYRAFATLIGESATLLRLREAGVVVPPSTKDRVAALREVRRVLSEFPGIPSFWWLAYRLAEESDATTAWSALSRARRLDPENEQFFAMSLLLSTRALPAREADAYIRQVRASLDTAGAEVCLMYAHAEIALAKGRGKEERWRQARAATSVGLSKARSEGLRKNLHATQLILDRLLAGEDPRMDVLYLAGLGEVAAATPPEGDVTDLVARMAKRRVNRMEERDALAA